jgi:demethylsterigmatocystin 6-O-methyltransferase
MAASQAQLYRFDNTGPIFQALPDYLAETSYADIPDGAHTVFQKAFDTDLTCFGWLPTQPKRFAHLQKLMTVTRQGDWLSVFPTNEEVGSWAAGENGILLVDVGGSMGHQCVNFRQRYPNIPGRMVLQDLPPVIQRVPPQNGIEAMSHDFFTPQPVQGQKPKTHLDILIHSGNLSFKGAKFYYLRQILHDYEDAKCVAILKNLLPALEPHSRVLIDDVVIPPTGAHWQEAAMDISMMAALGSKERTRNQFQRVFDEAGYKIIGAHPYSWPVENTVLVIVPK